VALRAAGESFQGLPPGVMQSHPITEELVGFPVDCYGGFSQFWVVKPVRVAIKGCLGIYVLKQQEDPFKAFDAAVDIDVE